MAAHSTLSEDTVYKMLIAQVHVGTENLDHQMQRYIWNRRADGQFILNLQYTWDKIVLAARIIAAVENPKDVAVISARDWGQRAVLKFAHYTHATPIAGRFTPGTFTNQQQQKDFKEPRLILVTDTRVDHQPLQEASYVNIPTIAFANSDSPVQYVDVAIPCNNAAPQSIGLIYWLLCREVLRIRGTISRDEEWNVMPDLFFWRDPTKEEEAKDEDEAVRAAFGRGGDHQSDFTSKATTSSSGTFDPAGVSDSGTSGGRSRAADPWVTPDDSSTVRFTPPWSELPGAGSSAVGAAGTGGRTGAGAVGEDADQGWGVLDQ